MLIPAPRRVRLVMLAMLARRLHITRGPRAAPVRLVRAVRLVAPLALRGIIVQTQLVP